MSFMTSAEVAHRPWVLPCGVLKETTNDRQRYKNSNEHNRMPRWGNERAAEWA